jgi:hypothetical protein
MKHKYSDFRWASPQALKIPSGPTPFRSRAAIDVINQWLGDPACRVCVPVNPDGEIIGDEYVGIVRVLRSLDVAAVKTQVVRIDSSQDADYCWSMGIEIPGASMPQSPEAAEQKVRCACSETDDTSKSPWWIDDADPPYQCRPTVIRWQTLIDGDVEVER